MHCQPLRHNRQQLCRQLEPGGNPSGITVHTICPQALPWTGSVARVEALKLENEESRFRNGAVQVLKLHGSYSTWVPVQGGRREDLALAWGLGEA